jgi:SAM-dependent methyltransferase
MSKLTSKEKGVEEFDDVISDVAQYGRVQYWEGRYANEHEPFEWYFSYDYFQETVRSYIPLDRRVLIAGCGTSHMLGDMADDGYQQLVGADTSRVAIAQLKYRYRDYEQITFFQGNMTDTDLPDASFGAIIDKALFDSLLCTQMGNASIAQYVQEVSEDRLDMFDLVSQSFFFSTTLTIFPTSSLRFSVVFKRTRQVERLLDETGVFIIVSFGNPEQRLPHIEQYDIDEPHFTPWVVEVQAVRKFLSQLSLVSFSCAFLDFLFAVRPRWCFVGVLTSVQPNQKPF